VPKAKKSTAQRRILRFHEKFSHKTVPIRFKYYLSRMSSLLRTELINLDELERQIYADLDSKSVASDLYPYYMAFSKRVFKTYLDFIEPTASTEAATLKQEFTQRGLDPAILTQLIPICKNIAETIRGF